MTTAPQIIVVSDANVLINLMHVARLDLCSRLPGYEFVVPDHVREEITDANQRMALDDAVVRSVVRIEAITDLSAVTLFTGESRSMVSCVRCANRQVLNALIELARLPRAVLLLLALPEFKVGKILQATFVISRQLR